MTDKDRRAHRDICEARGVTNGVLLGLCGWGIVMVILLSRYIWG